MTFIYEFDPYSYFAPRPRLLFQPSGISALMQILLGGRNTWIWITCPWCAAGRSVDSQVRMRYCLRRRY